MNRVRFISVAVVCCLAGTAAAAQHDRIETQQGAIHVWTPRGYDASTAGIVIYVHGYFTDVDNAWRRHRLARQFKASRLNALFIACEAPRYLDRPVVWTSAAALLDVVAQHRRLPEGRIVAVGHSGAHRTLSSWLAGDELDAIVLIDALYDDGERFREWLDAHPDRRLIDAAALTRRWTDALHADIPDTLVFDRFPSRRKGRLRGAREARVVYVHSQHDHMELVTGGVALPMLLRASRIPRTRSAR